MFAYIKGLLTETDTDRLVVECGGVGYELNVSSHTLSAMPLIGREVKLYAYLQTREDGMTLFGFHSREEKEMFLRLIGVSGIGPKVALAFLSVLKPSEIVLAVLADDVKTLCRAPGVGKKIAQRMVLELKDKLPAGEAFTVNLPAETAAAPVNEARGEALAALVQLGYSHSEALTALSRISDDTLSAEALLKQALKQMLR